jgi:hypothetical protein
MHPTNTVWRLLSAFRRISNNIRYRPDLDCGKVVARNSTNECPLNARSVANRLRPVASELALHGQVVRFARQLANPKL